MRVDPMTANASALRGTSPTDRPVWTAPAPTPCVGPPPSELAAGTREAAGLFKLFADETRLRILLLLKQEQELNVQSLCGLLRQAQPAVSHHLALLREADMVQLRRSGKHHFYRLRPKRFADIAVALRKFLPESLSAEISDRNSSHTG